MLCRKCIKPGRFQIWWYFKSASAEGNKPTSTCCAWRKGKDLSFESCVRSVILIPLASYSGCQAASETKEGFHFDLKICGEPKQLSVISMPLNLIQVYESSFIFDQSIAFAFCGEETRTGWEFSKSRCPALCQTLKKGNGKEKNGYNLNPFSLLS